MNFSEYCALDGVNSSTLKAMLISPRHYLHATTHQREDTPAMRLGRAVHTAVLEPDRLMRDFVVWEGARRGKEWAEFQIVHEGRSILTADEWDEVCAIRDAVHEHEVARFYLRDGEAEKTLVWTDPDTLLHCKARVDYLRPGLVIDLKTSRDISPRAFANTTEALAYHLQAAHYVAGAEMSCDAGTFTDHNFLFIAVESNPPHDVRVGYLTEDALWWGEQERKRLLRLVADCRASGEWPGAYPEVTDFDLPAWVYAKGDAEAVAAIEGTR